MDFLLDPALIASFISLTILEVILGIDNVIFIALLVEHLPPKERKKIRNIGLLLAFFFRVAMLLGIAWIIGLKEPIIHILDYSFSGKDLMMLAGGIFLIYKATMGVHEEFTGETKQEYSYLKGAFFAMISQIILIDIVFSFDSIMTAVGVTDHTTIIILAMGIAMFIMLFASNTIAHFIQTYPSLKMLTLAFVLLIGVLLTAEAFGVHVPKEYIYAAMAFSLSVETLNIIHGHKQKQRK
jgi:predicted tellurium resistance membrane protein TerC